MDVEFYRYSPEGHEEKDTHVLRTAVDRGVAYASSLIRDRFERPHKPHDKLEFHVQQHTFEVVRRVETILRALKSFDPSLVIEKDILLGKFAAAFHDVVQQYRELSQSEAGHGKMMRQRLSGDNESSSAQEATDFAEEVNRTLGQEVFSDEDLKIVEEAIAATIPAFDNVSSTVIQPNLNDRSHLVTRAVALADLGTAGIDGADRFVIEGDALFREENLDITDALLRVKHFSEIDESTQEYFRSRMLKWLRSQPQFARGRKDRLDIELGPLSAAAKQYLKMNLFREFDNAIEAAETKARDAEHLSFKDLARSMGYQAKAN